MTKETEMFDDFDNEYQTLVDRDTFASEYGDMLAAFDTDDDEFNDDPEWAEAMRDELEWSE